MFYVGIGKIDNFRRAYQKISRNNFWKNVVKKTEYDVKILFTGLTWNESCNIEKQLIVEYGRKDLGKGSLTNLTDGGDGSINLSEESKIKISNSLKGRKQSEKTKIKRANTLKKVWEDNELRELKRKQTIELNKLGLIGNKGKPSKKKGLPFSGDKNKLSKSLKEYYSTNDIHNKIILDDDLINDIINLYYNGYTIFKLSNIYKLNRKVISRIFKEKNVLLKEKNNTYDIIKQLYIDENKNRDEISKSLNCSVSNVDRLIKKYKLTKRKK